VCSVCIEAFRLLTIYLKPVLPALAAQVEGFLRVEPLDWHDAGRSLGAHTIGSYQHLMQRVEPKQVDALFEPAAAPVACRVASRWPRRSRSTTSPRSIFAWRRSSTPSLSKAATSCCA
jgi:methionyl-tRNA synthetase